MNCSRRRHRLTAGAANPLGVTQRAARLNVEKLIEIGILKEASGRRRNRIFAATEIFDILEACEIYTKKAPSRSRSANY